MECKLKCYRGVKGLLCVVWCVMSVILSSGAAFGAVGAMFPHVLIAGAIGGLGASFLAATFNYSMSSSCNQAPSCQ